MRQSSSSPSLDEPEKDGDDTCGSFDEDDDDDVDVVGGVEGGEKEDGM